MKSLIKKILKEESEELGRMAKLKKQRYSPFRDMMFWDDEEDKYVYKSSTDPEFMDWIMRDLRHRGRGIMKPIDVGFKFQTVAFEVPFVDQPIDARLFSEIDVQNVTTKEELASLHGEDIVDGFINMMAFDYDLTDEQSILKQYKNLARFYKTMATHHEQDHFRKH
jgi:hypothetical protein